MAGIPEEANNKQSKARKGDKKAGNLANLRDLPDDANGYTHSGWACRLLDQMLLKPLRCCLPIFNRSDPQSVSGNSRTAVPSKDAATQNPALPESSGTSMSPLPARSVQRDPPINRGPPPHHH